MMRTMQLMFMLIPQIWVVPYIENDEAAVAVYLKSPLLFWKRWFDVDDDFHKSIPALVVDGAHRRYVSLSLSIVQLRCNFLQPTMSVYEMVRAALFVLSLVRLLTHNQQKHTLPHAL